MSKSQVLKTLVNERLTAAAEEIFALFETTIAAYEKELYRSKEENQRKQQLLDSATAMKHHPGVQMNPPPCLGLDLNLEITKVVIKEEPEEQTVQQQEGESKREEEASVLQRRQSEHREEAQGSEIHLHPERWRLAGHVDADDSTRGPAFSYVTAQKEEWVDGSLYSQMPHSQPAPETSASVNDFGDESGADGGGEAKKHECSVCKKRFTRKQHLDLHSRVHSGEKPYSCTICNRTFALKGTLEVHKRTHTGERPYSCSICKKTFTQTSALNSHRRTHTGEKPFSCPMCKKSFGQKVHLEVHMRSHTGERPYCCEFCSKPFADSYNLKIHMRVHTGEKPYRCSVCQKGFTVSSNLRAHERTHTAP